MAADGRNMLHAASGASWERCFQLISNGAPIDFVADQSGFTATFHAVTHMEPQVLQTLLQLGASPRTALPSGINLVSWAVRKAAEAEKKDSLERLQATLTILKDAGAPFRPFDPESVQVLESCASIRMIHWVSSTLLGTAQTEVGVVADLFQRGLLPVMKHIRPRLHKAAEHGSLETVQALIECGEDVNAKHIGGTPLTMAAGAGHVEIVRELLRHKANPCELSTPLLRTPPLHAAINSGKWELVQMLLEAGAPLTTVDVEGHTVLCQAIAADQREMFFKFVAMGADPYIQLPGAVTLLHIAAQYNRTWCLPFLIVERGLTVNARKMPEKFTPLVIAVRSRSYDVIRELITTYKANATLCSWDKDTWTDETALHIAAGLDYGCLRLMISLGCDVRVGTEANPTYTLLHAAARHGNMLCVQWLLHMRYFDVNVRDIAGRTPMHCARPAHNEVFPVNLILWLINEADADVDAEDCNSVRPLYFSSSNLVLVKSLVENGATDVPCSDGLSAHDLAYDDQNTEVITLLCNNVRLTRLL